MARPGSIPACTGEPAGRMIETPGTRVYPRVYGGTSRVAAQFRVEGGLSPRVRGNPDLAGDLSTQWGSIPACTGEPQTRRGAVTSCQVYPRVYGGTETACRQESPPPGLSPRVRGNPPQRCTTSCSRRSIPACTGEPSKRADFGTLWRVYPRVYGGTFRLSAASRSRRGLSPRVRGNHDAQAALSAARRSIPACTGEPRCNRRGARQTAVYPRVYGGTRWRPGDSRPCMGLSPRVRGNPVVTASCWCW